MSAKLTLMAMEWEEKRTTAKRLYSEADAIELVIVSALGVGGSFRMGEDWPHGCGE